MMNLSPMKAITAHCKECVYDNKDSGTWRQQTEACQITSCPLHQHRPVTGGRNASSRKLDLTEEERKARAKRMASKN
jgi:hypothetical protein